MKNKLGRSAKRALAVVLSLTLILPLLGANLFVANAETVKLTADSSSAITVASGENKILDLAGHTLTGIVTNNGTLTVTDSVGGGKIGFTTGSDGIQAAIVNNGSLTVDGAHIELIGTGGLTQAVGILNNKGASLWVESGTVEAITNGTYWSYGVLNEGGTVEEISGGTIRAIKNNNTTGLNIMCINNRAAGVIKLISGGELYAYSKCSGGWALAIRNQAGASIQKITGGILRAEVDGTGEADAIAIRNENGSIGEISGGLIEGIVGASGNGNSEAVGLNNIGGQTVTKISGGVISAKALGNANKNNCSKAFALRNEGNAVVKEICGGLITSYTSAGEWAFGIDNWANGKIEKISGGNINVTIDHNNAAPNGIAIANKGTITEISGGEFYSSTVCRDGSAMGLRNQENAVVTTISGGTFYARAISGSACKAYGIYNQKGTIGEIKGDALIVGHTTATQYSFGIWNESTINTISGGTVVGIIERSTGGYNTLAISNDNSGVIKNITGGVFYAYSSSPEGDTYAIRTRNNAKIENISGGAFYINKQGDNRIIRVEGTGSAAYASGYAFTEGYSESGYKYVVPAGASVSEAYVDTQVLKIATVTSSAGAKLAEYALYGTAIYVAQVNGEKYVSIEEACEAAKEGGAAVTLITDVKAGAVPAGMTAVIDLAGYTLGDITVEDTSSATLKNGIVSGKMTGDIKLQNIAASDLGDASADAGYTVSSGSESGYIYVIPEGGSAVDLYYYDEFIAVRIFDAQGKKTAQLGSTQIDGYVLVGWSKDASGMATVADSAVSADMGELYGVWTKKPLYYFLGSSVTYGSATGGRSFVEEIAELYPIDYNKQAVSGTTLVDNGSSSYVQRMLNNFDPERAPDRLIVQLSTNDASQGKPLGSISDSKDLSSFDTTTIIGAIEYIIAYADKTWNAPVAFYTNPKYSSDAYLAMVNALYDIQKKWDIQIIDFYNYVDMEELTSAQLAAYMSDSIHPNSEGYKWMAGIMGKALIDADHSECECLWTVTKEATCTEDGEASGACAICSKDHEISVAAEHSYDGDGVCRVCGTELVILGLDEGESYDTYYQDRKGANGTKDYRVVLVLDGEYLGSITKLTARIKFTGDSERIIEHEIHKAYYEIHALDTDGTLTMYVAEDGTVIMGCVILGVPSGYTIDSVEIIAE